MANPLYDALSQGYGPVKATFLHLPDKSTIDYQSFFDLTAQLAHALVKSGVRANDRVAAQVHKSPAALALYVASVRCGAVFLPLNTAYTEHEFEYFINDAEPTVIVVDPEKEGQTNSLVTQSNCAVLTLNAQGHGSLTDIARLCSTGFIPTSRTPDDLAAILYTSGTTGRSKGAMLTQQNLLSNARTLVSYWQFSSTDVLLHALPIYHTHGLFVACNICLLAGASMIFLPKYEQELVIHSLPDATVMMGVPTFYTRLLDDARFSRKLTAHIRLFVSGSAPLLADAHLAFEKKIGHRILERYGMTETNMNTSNPYAGERIAGTVGLPLPNVEVKIVDQKTGNTAAQCEVGMLQVRGPNVFKGYWQMPEKTKEEFTANGFFITGDLASQDENGYISIVGRDKDMIISGGFNVYPKEVELLLDELPGIDESAVVAAPHNDFGEAVVAYIVLDDSDVANTVSEAHLKEALQKRLARYKQPKRILFLDALPRNAMGKVQKKMLREQAARLFRKS